MSDTFTKPPGDGSGTTHEEIAASPEFADLKRRFRSFIFPMTAAVPGLVLPLRAARGLRARLHVDQGVRQHQHRPAARAAASSSSTFAITMVVPQLGRQEVRPGCRASCASGSREGARERVPGLAAPAADVGNPALNITIFGLFVVVTLAIVIRASRNNKTAADYYAGGRSFTGPQNGIAIAGDYLSAASLPRHRRGDRDQRLRRLPLLHRLPGRVARRAAAGRRAAAQHRQVHDGRRALASGCKQRPVRMAAALSHARRLLLLPARADGRRRRPGRPAARRHGHRPRRTPSIAVVGVLMIVYVLVGGMKGTTWVQIIKAVLLIAGAGVMTVWVLAKYGFNLSDAARRGGRQGEQRGRGERRGPARPGQAVRRDDTASSTSSRWRWPWCSAPPACRTC